MCYHYTNRLKFGRSGSNARQCAYQAHTLPSEIHPRADNWAWTSDLLITNQLRYQLRHAGIKMTVRFGLTIAELQSAALNHLATSSSGGRFPHVSGESERKFTEPSKTECKGFEPLCRDTRLWISNPVQLTCSANTPKSRCKNFRRSYPLTELNRLPKLYWLEHCFTSATPHPGLEPGT